MSLPPLPQAVIRPPVANVAPKPTTPTVLTPAVKKPLPPIPSSSTLSPGEPKFDDNGLYIPDLVGESEERTMMLALVGAPGTGKTTSALTFPNPIVLNFDNKLPRGTRSVDFYKDEVCDKLTTRTVGRADRCRALQKWLGWNMQYFTPLQTIILDSWTLLMNAFDAHTLLEEPMFAMSTNSKTGEKSLDARWFWSQKLEYCRNVIELLKSGKCNVIVIFHEFIERDEKGKPTGKLEPLMDGKFKDQVFAHFTDVYRCISNPTTPESSKLTPDEQAKRSDFYWQIAGDSLVATNTNPVIGKVIRSKGIKRIPAYYDELQKLIQESKIC